MRLHSVKCFAAGTFLLAVAGFALPVFAAKPVDLHSQSVAILQSFSASHYSVKEVSRKSDFNHTTHIRLQQMYAGYPVYGADAVIHMPEGKPGYMSKTSMNGVFYQALDQDLMQAPPYVFQEIQATKALSSAIALYRKKVSLQFSVSEAKTQLMILIDEHNDAHWAYRVSFLASAAGAKPAKPVYLLDALTLAVYKAWDNIQSVSLVKAGGYGGNEKMGRFTYDALVGNAPALDVQRDNKRSICYLANDEVTVKDARTSSLVQFNCEAKNHNHNDVYWDADFDSINGAYSPANDALRIGKIVKDMYQKWYGIPVLVNHNGNPMMLNMVVHEKMENAYWDGSRMIFGDGENYFYPMVSLGVGAHEIAHGFTAQNSRLEYVGPSGGINESFSDMAAQAAEYYVSGHNNWQIGSEITKARDKALRYMNDPTNDCPFGVHPGDDCSIARVKDYHPDLDVHYSSGVFNKVFYLLGTSHGWNTKKAFDVMLQANTHYWNPTDDFEKAACGVIWAAKDYGYDLGAVIKAMEAVGINTAKC